MAQRDLFMWLLLNLKQETKYRKHIFSQYTFFQTNYGSLYHRLFIPKYDLTFFPFLLFLKDFFNETEESPTSWAITTLDDQQKLNQIETKLTGSRGTEIKDWNRNESLLKINLTLVNSTFNYTTINEVWIYKLYTFEYSNHFWDGLKWTLSINASHCLDWFYLFILPLFSSIIPFGS